MVLVLELVLELELVLVLALEGDIPDGPEREEGRRPEHRIQKALALTRHRGQLNVSVFFVLAGDQFRQNVFLSGL